MSDIAESFLGSDHPVSRTRSQDSAPEAVALRLQEKGSFQRTQQGAKAQAQPEALVPRRLKTPKETQKEGNMEARAPPSSRGPPRATVSASGCPL